MNYRGSCHCGRIAFEVEGIARRSDVLQLLYLSTQGLASCGPSPAIAFAS